jgi:hypothetical protein
MKPGNVGSTAFKFNEPIDPALTPLSLLSSIFGRFKSDMRIEIETEEMFADFKASRALITGMSYPYPTEDDRRRFLINWIVETYGGRLETMVDETRGATDGHFVHTRAEGGNEYLIVLLEGERGGFSPGEPHIQGLAFYREFYRKRIGSSGYVTRGCMPALLLTYQGTFLSLSPLQLLIGTVTGCYLDASGLVVHPDGTVQMEPLWGMRLNYDWHSDFERGLIARFIWSVRNCIKDMKMFYDSKNAPLAYYQLEYQPAASEPNASPPMKKQKLDQFYPCYRGTNSGIKTFQYIRRLHNDGLLFLATEDGSRKQLLVKFAKRYATKVHELLASAEPALAPKLYACEDLPGGWKMAVIEFLPQEQWLTLDAFLRKNPEANIGVMVMNRLEEALNNLKSRGFVHGDIRPYNILVSKSEAGIDVRLIDFDYSGEANKDRYPRDWNYMVRPKGAVGGALMKVEHDKTMVNDLFTHIPLRMERVFHVYSSNENII